jgi:hypothetical protein
MALGLFIRVPIRQYTINTTSSQSSRGDALALFASPRTGLISRTESFDSTGNERGLSCLSPLALVLVAACEAAD